MALNDPNVIAQVDARLLNIESKVELRFANNEKRIDEFVEQLKTMTQNADENDKSIKTEIRDRFTAVEQTNATRFAEVSAAMSGAVSVAVSGAMNEAVSAAVGGAVSGEWSSEWSSDCSKWSSALSRHNSNAYR